MIGVHREGKVEGAPIAGGGDLLSTKKESAGKGFIRGFKNSGVTWKGE